MIPVHDVARTRLDNALLLFDEFVRVSAATPDVATLRGLERRFAERLEIQPSYWSQIKSRSRQIGERLARQFEQRCKKPVGWMDVPHVTGGNPAASQGLAPQASASLPLDDDERFIVGLVLTYYRRHPQRARTRLLDLLGEVLTPMPEAPADTPPPQGGRPAAVRGAARVAAPAEDLALWASSAAGIAPLKKKR
ncbi:MAG: hypothetical protein IPP44_15665 [Ideonella sp.]|nr:hypothetical protein [Ideonella sp.]